MIYSNKNENLRKSILEIFEKALIETVISISDNNKSKAAEYLGYNQPQALYNKCRELEVKYNNTNE